MFYPILIHSRHSEPPQGSFGGHDGFISQPLTRAAQGHARMTTLVKAAFAVLALAFTGPVLAQTGLPPAIDEPVSFTQQIQPLLKQRCYACHSETISNNELRLDRKQDALRGGHSGPSIIPGDSAKSRLIHLVAGYRVKVVMPPAGPPLSPAEIGLLRAWIDQGADWPEEQVSVVISGAKRETSHWAFQPIRRPTPPGGIHPIDHFVSQRLAREGLKPSPQADRATLIRRLSLDTTGLPPTPDERLAFVNDTRPDFYARTVDRLLSSPHFGEKQALHWLDQARYADSDGYAKDLFRPHAWRYRRWVIEALNSGMPFDRFSIEQIAGDLLPSPTVEQRVATGFHRNTLKNREGGVDPDQYLFEETVDRAGAIGTVWLGLTVGCAQCHDHKYDPISQRDFYELFAFFDNIEEAHIYAPIPGEIGPHLVTVNEYRRKHQAILDEYNVPAIQADWEKKTLKAGDTPGVYLGYDLAYQELGLNTDGGQEIARLPVEQRSWRQANMVTYYFLGAYNLVTGAEKYKELRFAEAKRKLQALDESYQLLSEARVVTERARSEPSFLRVRGSWDRPGVEVQPAAPSALPAIKTNSRPTRLDLAKWLFTDDNPLTARVAVNRIWQEYFERGLVETSDDFGTQGAAPSHPELLDWLASEFRDSGWNVKHVHRLIVTSETYRQSSNADQALTARDPNNELLARQARIRLPAELIWDNALAVSGLIHHDVGGPSFRPAIPAGATGFGQAGWKVSSGKTRFKRGMYIQFQRNKPHPFLMNFDSPEFRASVCRRDSSNTPLQALNLLNDPTFAEAGRALAVRILTEAPGQTFAERLKYAYQLVLAREPYADEQERFLGYWTQRRKTAASDLPHVEGLDPSLIPAWSGITRILMNLDEFVTRP